MNWRICILAASAIVLSGPAWCDTGSNATPQTSALVWTPKDGDEIRFNVLRKGMPFGSHTVRFDVAPGGTIKATTQVKLRAGIGPIPLYRYDLVATERWQDGRLVELDGDVNKDGSKGSVTAYADGDVIEVDGTAYEGAVSATIIPASHWNIAETQARTLLSSENGQLIDVSVTKVGRETVTVAGQPIDATRYLLDSDIDVTLWYDDAGHWLKLAFTARGQDIDYVLVEPYWDDPR